ncbi:MAG: ABC transporter ATP-binding protein [Spirochaetaceae bacterium]|nr:ABC transporter ATP-binding protein [Spirochaetaceae bacterium]
MHNNLLVTAKNITINYGSYCAVEDVSFSIHEGDYLCIVGANGSGKSTLIKSLLGLLPIKTGNFTFSDELNNRRTLGYLPQQNLIQKDFPASVFEVVLSGCANKLGLKPFYSKADKKTALENIEKLQIANLKNHSFQDLSGGQQQRVLLARSLCAAKKILVLDEPVTGLDPKVTDELYQIIQDLHQKEKIAIVMISHDIHRAIHNATHILHMNKQCEFFGTSEDYQKTELFHSMSHIEVCNTHHLSSCGKEHFCKASHIY